MGQVEIIVDGVLVTFELLIQILIDGLSLCNVLDEVRNLLIMLVAPGVNVAPMGVEFFL